MGENSRSAPLIAGLLILLLLGLAPAGAQTGGDRVARIGVLAFRGAEAARARWQPLADYLGASVNGWRFVVVPVTLVSAQDKIRAKELDFLVTNPGHYVTLAGDHGLSVLATRERRESGKATGLLTYGTAIVTRADGEIRALDELRGRRLAAVSPEAFGGFQMAWFELRRQNIDAFSDLQSIRFMGFPQDAIVTAVLEGEVDAGVVRSGLLENLAAEGRLSLGDLRVLGGNQQLEYPYRVSGHLYPEWPFTALPGIDKRLREGVARALLDSQNPEAARAHGLIDIWSAPLSYESVRRLTDAFANRFAPAPARGRPVDGPLVLAAAALLLSGALIWVAVAMARQRGRVALPVQEPAEDDPETRAARPRFESLTRREREVLTLICAGKPSKAIAAELGISPKTVEYHRANLLQKTDAGTTAHLVQLATRLGFDLGFSRGLSKQ